MSPVEVAAVVRLRLAAELDDELRSLDALADAIARLLPPASDERAEWMRKLALAFEVERYYTAVESALARTLRALDGELPGGATWHQDLLRAASVAIEGGRPALLTAQTVIELRELLKFRHLARHGYDREPELRAMEEHAVRVARAHAGLGASLAALRSWLRGGP